MGHTKVVLGIPVSDRNLGSCRARYFHMLENLPADWTWTRYTPDAVGDILYIQKTESKEAWEAIWRCKQLGIPIVYERDDFCQPWNKEHTKIMDAADAVTIITRAMTEKVQQYTKTQCYHVQNSFDYIIDPTQRCKINDKLARVVTYGRHANVESAGRYFKRIKQKKAYICDRVIAEMKGAKYVEWKLKNFIKKIRRYDFVIVVHADSFRQKYKDSGRALLAMAVGMPVAATSNIEMKRVFNEVGYPWMLMKQPADIERIIKRIKPKSVREQMSQDMYDYAWTNWRQTIASRQLATVFQRVIDEKSALS